MTKCLTSSNTRLDEVLCGARKMRTDDCLGKKISAARESWSLRRRASFLHYCCCRDFRRRHRHRENYRPRRHLHRYSRG